MPTEVSQISAAAPPVAAENGSAARERGASCISLLAQRRNVLIVCLLSVVAWALLDVRSTAQFRRHHEAHDLVNEGFRSSSNGDASWLLSSDGLLRGSQPPEEEGGGGGGGGSDFDLLDLAETERGWKHRRMQLGSANRSVSLVFFAGLEGTGHHFWQSFLKEFCHHQDRLGGASSGGRDEKQHNVAAAASRLAAAPPPPPSAVCVELSEKIFKLARGVFKRCAPKFDSSHSHHHGNGSEIKTPKLLTSANHCYLREASQQGLVDLADGILKSVEQRITAEKQQRSNATHGGSNNLTSSSSSSSSSSSAGSTTGHKASEEDIPIFAFANAFGSNQMWSYPNGKTFNDGRGWNPDASALALVADRLGINFRTVWLRRSPASLLASTARRSFAEKKTRGKEVSELDGAGNNDNNNNNNNKNNNNNSAASLADELQLQGPDFETAARLLEYLGVLTHSQRTLAAQVAHLGSVTASSSNTSARVMGVWHHEVSCKPVALAESVGAFLIEDAILSPAQRYNFMEQWVTAFEHVATCSDAAAATLADQRPGCHGADAHTTYEACDDMSLYLRTLPESDGLARRVKRFATDYVSSSFTDGCAKMVHCREALLGKMAKLELGENPGNLELDNMKQPEKAPQATKRKVTKEVPKQGSDFFIHNQDKMQELESMEYEIGGFTDPPKPAQTAPAPAPIPAQPTPVKKKRKVSEKQLAHLPVAKMRAKKKAKRDAELAARPNPAPAPAPVKVKTDDEKAVKRARKRQEMKRKEQ